MCKSHTWFYLTGCAHFKFKAINQSKLLLKTIQYTNSTMGSKEKNNYPVSSTVTLTVTQLIHPYTHTHTPTCTHTHKHPHAHSLTHRNWIRNTSSTSSHRKHSGRFCVCEKVKWWPMNCERFLAASWMSSQFLIWLLKTVIKSLRWVWCLWVAVGRPAYQSLQLEWTRREQHFSLASQEQPVLTLGP